MKNAIMFILAATLATTTFATSSILQVAECSLEQRMVDNGLSVKIIQYSGPVRLGKNSVVYHAELQRFLFSGPTPKKVFGPLTLVQPAPSAKGGSTEYLNPDFNLTLLTDSLHVNGKTRARLVYELNGVRNSENLLCDLTVKFPRE